MQRLLYEPGLRDAGWNQEGAQQDVAALVGPGYQQGHCPCCWQPVATLGSRRHGVPTQSTLVESDARYVGHRVQPAEVAT